ncbi:MAG: hypothetical protein V2A73_00215 [Pseudomonadota bacterium]
MMRATDAPSRLSSRASSRTSSGVVVLVLLAALAAAGCPEGREEPSPTPGECATQDPATCAANGCLVYSMYRYDTSAQCHAGALEQVFCSDREIDCTGPGSPVIATDQIGDPERWWYAPDSCLPFPKSWKVEYLTEERAECGEVACEKQELATCEENGCVAYSMYRYDTSAQCHADGEEQVFCGDPIKCRKPGGPAIATDQIGDPERWWYAPDSCMPFPESWKVVNLSDELPVCRKDPCADLDAASCHLNPSCIAYEMYPYDDYGECHQPAARMAFCSGIALDCAASPPVIANDEEGHRWYAPDSCFPFPKSWKVEYLEAPRPMCGPPIPCEEQDPATCAANGCVAFSLYSFDRARQCHAEAKEPVFCGNRKPDCGKLAPLLIMDPVGNEWYSPEGCYPFPASWKLEYLNIKYPVCGDDPCEEQTSATCEANGCHAYDMFLYDSENECHVAVLREFAFCSSVHVDPAECLPDGPSDGGPPVVATDYQGYSWYAPESCYPFPASWSIEYLTEERSLCPDFCNADFSCWEQDPTTCEASGCGGAVEMHRYDAERACFEEAAVPAFCSKCPIMCIWAGPPIVLSDPDGNLWYSPTSCFAFPTTWQPVSVEVGSNGMCGTSSRP